MNRLFCGDVLDVLPKFRERFHCLIADPPDNIGLKYNKYDDNLSSEEYREWLFECLLCCVDHADIVWFSFNAKHMMTFLHDVERSLEYHFCTRVFIQTFTFGQNRTTDCGNGFRPVLRIVNNHSALYPDAIKVESARQRAGDKRAAPGGKVPLDVWDFPRITGNCRERRSWHPTQLREAMIQRIVNFSTLPGGTVCDAFSGTGTVLRAVKDRSITSIELDRGYCDRIAEEHGLEVETL